MKSYSVVRTPKHNFVSIFFFIKRVRQLIKRKLTQDEMFFMN